MIVLDTNVISSFIKSEPDEIVVNWLNKIEPHIVWITAISVLEIQYGISLLPTGKKRDRISEAFKRMLNEKFQNRVLDLNAESALAAAEIAAKHKKSGNNIDMRDSMIAGIVLSQDAFLATRNIKDFQNINLRIINPWHD